MHARNGVSHLAALDEAEAVAVVRSLLGYLPRSAWDVPPVIPSLPPELPDPFGAVPADLRRPYDVRDVIRAITDGGSSLEVAPRWAPHLVTSFARLSDHPIGVVANQPRQRGGVLDGEAAQKGARFVRLCNAFGLALLVLVDTPGFLPGTRQEGDGVIRHGAKLLHAFVEAEVGLIGANTPERAGSVNPPVAAGAIG